MMMSDTFETEGRSCELEDKRVEMTESEEQKEKKEE